MDFTAEDMEVLDPALSFLERGAKYSEGDLRAILGSSEAADRFISFLFEGAPAGATIEVG